MPKNKVVIVIPTYNEAGNIVPVSRALRQIFRRCSGYDMHILFVDDNSPDGTASRVAAVIKQYPFIHILHNKRKGGLGHAYKKGFLHALDKLHADILFQFDADLQHDPVVIPAMLDSLSDGADLVLGSRYIPGGGIPSNWGIHRKFLSIVGNAFIRTVMLKPSVRDWTTGYRAIKRSVAETVLPELTGQRFTGYTYQIGFLTQAIAHGFRIAEVPFIFQDRKYGQSKLGPEYIINNLLYILKERMKTLFKSRIFKFVMVGGFGSLVQFVALYFYRLALPYQLAFFLSIETAIISNFTWSNLWTFSDRKLSATQVPGKFLQFNLASGGSILIQQTVALIGENTLGFINLFTIPFTHIVIDTGMMYAVVGILIGMFWNFFAYSRLVWKKQ